MQEVPFSITLNVREWNVVLQILGEQKYSLVAAVIAQMQEQFAQSAKPASFTVVKREGDD